MFVCTAIILGVSQSFAARALWPVADQPELKQALEQAPLLRTESLGEPARGVNVWERWMVPNPDGQSWDVLQIYFKEYYGPTWLCAIDLGTGQVRKQRLPDHHQFYLSGRALAFDGKYYVTVMGDPQPGDAVIKVIKGDQVEVFATGMDEPKGIAFVGRFLVTTDLKRVWKIDAMGNKTVLAAEHAFQKPVSYLNEPDMKAGTLVDVPLE